MHTSPNIRQRGEPAPWMTSVHSPAHHFSSVVITDLYGHVHLNELLTTQDPSRRGYWILRLHARIS